MPAVINFGVFDTQDISNSDVNMGLAISVSPTFHGKLNEGYGFNIGDYKYVPSYSVLIDTDMVDNPRWNPTFAPTNSSGA